MRCVITLFLCKRQRTNVCIILCAHSLGRPLFCSLKKGRVFPYVYFFLRLNTPVSAEWLRKRRLHSGAADVPRVILQWCCCEASYYNWLQCLGTERPNQWGSLMCMNSVPNETTLLLKFSFDAPHRCFRIPVLINSFVFFAYALYGRKL